MEFCTITLEQFDAFAASYIHQNFWQSSQMTRLEERKGWKGHYVGVKVDGEVIAATTLISMPVFRGNCIFKALRGFMLDYEDAQLLAFFVTNLKAYLKKEKCLYIKIDPYFPYKERDLDGNLVEGGFDHSAVVNQLQELGFEHHGFRNHFDAEGEPRWMSVLDLKDKTEEEILKGMHVRTRQNVNNTIKTGIKYKELTRSELGKLEEIVDETGNRRGFYKPDLAYYETVYDCFGDSAKAMYAYLDLHDYTARIQADIDEQDTSKEAILCSLKENPNSKKNEKRLKMCEDMLVALRKRKEEADELVREHGDEIPMAAALFIINNHEIIYLFSGSDNTFKRFKASYAIQWHMIRYAIKEKIPYYNFYGISGTFTEEADDYGVYLFKKGFNANVVELLGDFTCVINPKAYKLYNSLRKVKHMLVK